MADILVVDDDCDIAEALSELLTLEGHGVRVACDGVAGLACLDCGLPDLVLLDVEMPRMSGPEMADRMFVHDLGRERIPVILLSGEVDLARLAEAVGTPYALGKPFTIEEAKALIDQALREKKGLSPPRGSFPPPDWTKGVRTSAR